MNAYEIEKLYHSKLPPLNKGKLEIAREKIVEPFILKHETARFFLLLNNETRYYTMFNVVKDKNKLSYELIELITEDLGKVRDLEYDEESDAIALWIEFENETRLFYFFEADQMVVNV